MSRFAAIMAMTVLGAWLLAGCAPSEQSIDEGTQAVTEDWELTPELIDRLYEAKLENLRQIYGLDHPIDAPLVRYVTATEIADVISTCAAEAGFTVIPGAQGGVEIGEVPEAQQDALNEAMARCEAMYPLDPRMHMKLPRVRAEAQYHFLTESVAPCVEEQGYSLTKPPSLQAWLDSYYSTGSAWDPIAIAAEQMLPADGQTPLDELYKACKTISEDVYPPMDLDDLAGAP